MGRLLSVPVQKKKQKEKRLNPGNSGMYRTVHNPTACEAEKWVVPGPPQALKRSLSVFC